MEANMFKVLKHRNFRHLWLGGLISMMGNWVLLAAMPFYIYDLTGSALATGGIFMAYVAPRVLFSSVAGVFVDRWNRRKTMMVIAILQAVAVMGLMFVNSAQDVWLIYVVVFIQSTLGSFFAPAENALLPRLVGEEDLMAANSLNSLNDNLARLLGPALGGALLATSGFATVALVDAITYVAAAVLIFSVSAPQSETAPAKQPDGSGRLLGVWRDWIAGLKLVVGDKLLARLFVIVAFALFGDAILSAVLVVFIQDDLGLGAVEFGTMMTARGLGGIVGGVVIAYVASKLSMEQIAAGSLAIVGVIILAMVAFPSMVILLPLLVLVGIASIFGFITIQTVLQLGTEDQFRGRVFGAFGMTVSLLMFAGSGIGGALADILGAEILMNFTGVIYIVAAGLAAILLTSPLQALKARTAAA
jgi:MFS family permease